jgi:hypothetical protein
MLAIYTSKVKNLYNRSQASIMYVCLAIGHWFLKISKKNYYKINLGFTGKLSLNWLDIFNVEKLLNHKKFMENFYDVIKILGKCLLISILNLFR